ncbi:MAG: hypothetical protein GY750_16490 [Lentisphaerae bacterium]|nr:hypothetical protein [Lentisphaerota bacterium]
MRGTTDGVLYFHYKNFSNWFSGTERAKKRGRGTDFAKQIFKAKFTSQHDFLLKSFLRYFPNGLIKGRKLKDLCIMYKNNYLPRMIPKNDANEVLEEFYELYKNYSVFMFGQAHGRDTWRGDSFITDFLKFLTTKGVNIFNGHKFYVEWGTRRQERPYKRKNTAYSRFFEPSPNNNYDESRNRLYYNDILYLKDIWKNLGIYNNYYDLCKWYLDNIPTYYYDDPLNKRIIQG